MLALHSTMRRWRDRARVLQARDAAMSLGERFSSPRGAPVRLRGFKAEKDGTAPLSRRPVALLACHQEWSSRSLETVLTPHGYGVIGAYTGRDLLERARRSPPDVVLLDANLPDLDGLEACRLLHAEAHLRASTPIVVLTGGPPTRQRRLAALRAGAWELLAMPVDAEELLLKLDTWVQGKLEADRARDAGLVDPPSGLYNVEGLARRAREMTAEAFRRRTALACVVLGADPSADAGEESTRMPDDIARTLWRAGRSSDAIGRLGRGEFAVLAPATNAAAAVKLAERLSHAVTETFDHAQPLPVIRAGYEAVEDQHARPIEPLDLLVRAESALGLSRVEGDGARVRRYEHPSDVGPG